MEPLDRIIWSIHVKLKNILTRLGFRDKESCQLCGRNQYIGWSVPDWLWLAVVPHELQGKALCIECFANLGHDKDVTKYCAKWISWIFSAQDPKYIKIALKRLEADRQKRAQLEMNL